MNEMETGDTDEPEPRDLQICVIRSLPRQSASG